MSLVTGLKRAASTASAETIAAPPTLLFTGAFYLMVTAVLSALWSQAADANGGAIVGYSATALVWYVATSEATMIAIPIRLIEETGDDIGSGRVDVELLRPISLLWLRVAVQVGSLLPRLAICVVLGLGLALLVGGPPPDASSLLLALPAVAIAPLLNVVAQHAFAGAAFWLSDAKSTWFLYQKMVFVLGGMLLPLEIFPSWLENIARLLPFMAMSYVPARLASGHFEPGLIVLQLFWLAVAAIATTWLYRAGERRLRMAV